MLAKREYFYFKNMIDDVQKTLNTYSKSFDSEDYIAGWNNVRRRAKI